MLQSIGKFFKKLFTHDRNKSNFGTKQVVHGPERDKPMSAIRGSNGRKTYYDATKEWQFIKKVIRRRKKNRSARASRNAQHRIAA